jgi:hypothetical protein
MLKDIPKSDIIVRPIKVYKEWRLDENDISPIYATNPNNTFVDVDNDPQSQGIVKKVLYSSIESQFYRNADTASVLYEVGNRRSYASKDERILEDTIVVLPIPQPFYGEGIKVGTVTLTDNTNNNIYTDDGYSNLIDSGSNIKGNIFYDRGTIVLAKDVTDGSTLSSFFLDFRSTKTIFENEILINVLENEFNYSQNPSAVYEDGGRKISTNIQRPGSYRVGDIVSTTFYDPGIKWVRNKKYPFTSEIDTTKMGSFDDYLISGSVDPTGSYLAPYITTIGLYDNEMNMVAVAKLPQPIKSLPDYPLNFIIRFDT